MFSIFLIFFLSRSWEQLLHAHMEVWSSFTVGLLEGRAVRTVRVQKAPPPPAGLQHWRLAQGLCGGLVTRQVLNAYFGKSSDAAIHVFGLRPWWSGVQWEMRHWSCSEWLCAPNWKHSPFLWHFYLTIFRVPASVLSCVSLNQMFTLKFSPCITCGFRIYILIRIVVYQLHCTPLIHLYGTSGWLRRGPPWIVLL